MKRPQFKLRTLLMLVGIGAVLCWGYWIGWPWWTIYREQQRFLAAVTHTKVGMTASEMPPIDIGINCTKFQFELSRVDQTVVLVVAYAWKDRIYCVLYECVSGFGSKYNVSRPLTHIEVFELAPPLPNQPPVDASWANFLNSLHISDYASRFARFITGDSKENPGFKYDLIYSDPPADAPK